MSRRDLPPLLQRPPEPIDRIWWFALPAFYVLMVGYGITAAVFPLNSVTVTAGEERAALFGVAIAVSAALMVAGSFRSLLSQKPAVEWVATLLFLLLMAVYLVSIYHAVAAGEPAARPGSTFQPVLFSVFPFTRWVVIIRGGRLPWRHLRPRQ